MPDSQARRSTPASGAVAVAGSSGGPGSTVYGSPRRFDGPGHGYDSSDPHFDSSDPHFDGAELFDGAAGGPAFARDRGSAGGRGSGMRTGPGAASGGRMASSGGRVTSAGGRPPRGPRAASAPYAAPERVVRRDPLWARMLVIFGALLMLASGGAIVGGKVIIARATGSVDKAPLLGQAGANNDEKALKGPLNILMVGIDERPEGKDPIFADSILILHIPASHKEAYLVSVPRDSYVEIPAFAKTNFSGGEGKINSAFAHGYANGGGREGGFELLALAVQRLTNLKFNAGAIVDFKGFEAVVKALGGVEMCVDTTKTVYSEHVGFDSKGNYKHPREGGKPMEYHPGECRRFKGWEALDYVRQRYSLEDGDYGRQRHQQQFVRALAAEVKRQNLATNPRKLLQIIDAAGKALTIDRRDVSIETWLFTLRNMASGDVVLVKSNGGEFNSVPCGGESCEQLTPETLEMFQALGNNTFGEFVINHPELISK